MEKTVNPTMSSEQLVQQLNGLELDQQVLLSAKVGGRKLPGVFLVRKELIGRCTLEYVTPGEYSVKSGVVKTTHCVLECIYNILGSDAINRELIQFSIERPVDVVRSFYGISKDEWMKGSYSVYSLNDFIARINREIVYRPITIWSSYSSFPDKVRVAPAFIKDEQVFLLSCGKKVGFASNPIEAILRALVMLDSKGITSKPILTITDRGFKFVEDSLEYKAKLLALSLGDYEYSRLLMLISSNK